MDNESLLVDGISVILFCGVVDDAGQYDRSCFLLRQDKSERTVDNKMVEHISLIIPLVWLILQSFRSFWALGLFIKSSDCGWSPKTS